MINPKSIFAGRDKPAGRAAQLALAAFEDGIALDGALDYLKTLDKRPVIGRDKPATQKS
jgi:hypothetical protein